MAARPRIDLRARAASPGWLRVCRRPDPLLLRNCDEAVEGGGQVKAELVSVGQSGEQSLKRIETAGERATGGLKGLGRQAELLRSGIRTLGGALIGAATVGGLGALIDRSISAADAIGS